MVDHDALVSIMELRKENRRLEKEVRVLRMELLNLRKLCHDSGMDDYLHDMGVYPLQEAEKENFF